jgi:uncharacterized protein (TIRG00374 family)
MKDKSMAVKGLAFVLTVGILAAIYLHVDLHAMALRLIEVHPVYFSLALFFFLPQFLVTSIRWRIMVGAIHPLTFWESVKMVMAAKALNALVPAKLGELSKAYFLKRGQRADTGQSVSTVILEKILDMGGLCSVLLCGAILFTDRNEAVWIGVLIAGGVVSGVLFLIFMPLSRIAARLDSRGKRSMRISQLLSGWHAVLSTWREGKATLPLILSLSILLWVLHVAQIYLFFPSLRHPVPLAPALALIPLAILVGVIPITIGGMGTRDSVLIVLFAPYADAATMAGIGLLCTMRYWVDTLLGVPFFHRYTRTHGGPRPG